MRRRDALAMLAGTLMAATGVQAQQQRTVVLGILVTGALDPGLLLSVLEDEMKRLGYVKGANLRIELRSGEGREDLLLERARELARSRVDVIVAWLTPAVRAAKLATTEIPIVMAGAGDPVATGLVASLAKPGGNVTGMAAFTPDLATKTMELLRGLLPRAARLGVLCNGPDIFTPTFLDQIRRAAPSQGFELFPITVASPDQLERAFEEVTLAKLDALIVQPSLPLRRAARAALQARLPAASPIEGFAGEGGLLAYAGRTSAQFVQVASYIDRILRGARPSDLPIQLPTQFRLAINLATARALGINVPPELLVRADEVID